MNAKPKTYAQQSASVSEAANFAQLGDESKTSFILPRMGESPVKFDGKIIGKGSSQTRKGFTEKQWHDVALYETNGGNFILYIAYRTNGYMESDIYDVWVSDSPETARRTLLDYDPLEYSIGLPFYEEDYQNPADREAARARVSEKQEALENALSDGYHAIVARLLATDARFAEHID